jgi:hypothetical protein
MEVQERRNYAQTLVEMFVISDADIEIRYKFPDFLKEPAKDAHFKPAPETLETFKAPGKADALVGRLEALPR